MHASSTILVASTAREVANGRQHAYGLGGAHTWGKAVDSDPWEVWRQMPETEPCRTPTGRAVCASMLSPGGDQSMGRITFQNMCLNLVACGDWVGRVDPVRISPEAHKWRGAVVHES